MCQSREGEDGRRRRLGCVSFLLCLFGKLDDCYFRILLVLFDFPPGPSRTPDSRRLLVPSFFSSSTYRPSGKNIIKRIQRFQICLTSPPISTFLSFLNDLSPRCIDIGFFLVCDGLTELPPDNTDAAGEPCGFLNWKPARSAGVATRDVVSFHFSRYFCFPSLFEFLRLVFWLLPLWCAHGEASQRKSQRESRYHHHHQHHTAKMKKSCTFGKNVNTDKKIFLPTNSARICKRERLLHATHAKYK